MQVTKQHVQNSNCASPRIKTLMSSFECQYHGRMQTLVQRDHMWSFSIVYIYVFFILYKIVVNQTPIGISMFSGLTQQWFVIAITLWVSILDCFSAGLTGITPVAIVPHMKAELRLEVTGCLHS